MPQQIVLSGGFDDLRAVDMRLMREAARLGDVTVLLWPDEMIARIFGKAPKFPLAERQYFLNAIRYLKRVVVADAAQVVNSLPKNLPADVWVDTEAEKDSAREQFCREHGIAYRVLGSAELGGFPAPTAQPFTPGRKKIVVTGSFDWFHSGHVRFLEEASTHGDLFVVVGHDANIRLLKGAGHPLLPENERRFAVGSIKFVKQALISSGAGWLDADPEIRQLRPEIYAVNEDGDKGGKREYCDRLGIEYLVLKRSPAPGLPRRSSTDLRGF
jgi:cytidyltransferase-like protein